MVETASNRNEMKRVHAEIPIGHFARELPNLLEDAMRGKEKGREGRETQFDTNEVNICLEEVFFPLSFKHNYT